MSDFDPSSATPEFDPSSAQPEAAPKPKDSTTSQGLGFYKGVTTALDNAAQGAHWLASTGIIPGISPGTAQAGDQIGSMMGLPSVEQANQGHKDYIAAQQAKGIQPGAWGEFAGDVVGTAPLAATGLGPVGAGMTSGALLSEDQDPIHILENMALGAAGSKAGELAINKLAIPAVKKVGQLFQPAAQKVAPYVSAGTKYVQDLINASGKKVADIENFGSLSQPDKAAPSIIDNLGKRYEVGGAGIPSYGLAPANMAENGVVYTGLPDTVHFQIAEAIPHSERGDFTRLGFVTPSGEFLERDQALKWVAANERNVRPSDNMGSGLDALDYREQVPERLRKAAPSVPSISYKPVTAAEALGPTGVSAVSALARRQGATGEAASALLGERAAGTSDRVLNDYAQAAGIHPSAAQGNIDDLVAAGRSKASPLYKQVYDTPGPVWNSDLEVISRRPVVQQAIRSAAQDLLNADIKPGVLGLPSGPDDGKLLPTAQAWDLIKKSVADQVERHPLTNAPLPDSVSRGNANINKASRDLTDALKKAVPGYSDALAVSGDYLSLQNAFQKGQKYVLSRTMTAADFAKQFSKLSPAEQSAFKGGTANALFNKAQNAQLHPTAFKRPILQDKLNAVLGPDKAQPFLQGMQVEANMARAGARMAPGTNSITGEVMNATNEQDKNWLSSMFSAMKAAQHGAHGNLPSAAAHGLSALQDLGIFTKASTMPVPVRDEAGRLLLMKPSDLVSHLKGLYGKGDSAGVQRVTKFLAALKAPAQVALPALAIQSTSGSP